MYPARLRHHYHMLRARLRHLWRPPRPGSHSYGRHVQEEIRHYARVFDRPDERLIEPSPPVWEEIQRRVAQRIAAMSGADITGHLLRRLREKPGARLLSLGSGAGGVELAVAREAPRAEIVCVDLNAKLLALGRTQAEAEGLTVRFCPADLNTARFDWGRFGIVFCHASLHHLLNLDRVFEEIARCLEADGELIVVDVITRNGYGMWPETRKVARTLWATLPDRYRINHTAYPGKWMDKRIWEGDTRLAGMECARSEEVLPLLRTHFRETAHVPLLAFCRRFFDTMYGPNYELSRPLDRAIVDWLWQLDCRHLDSGALRPESFFGVFRLRE